VTVYQVNSITWCINLVNLLYLKGLCHQIRKAWKWYSFKGLDMDIRRLIFIIFKNLPLIFNRHFKFLCWGSKSVKIFYLFWTLFEAALNVFILLYFNRLFVSWNNFDYQCLFLIGYWISRIYFYHCSICVLKVAGVALYRSWTQIEENSLLNFSSGPK
jgi:hypothetical protein